MKEVRKQFESHVGQFPSELVWDDYENAYVPVDYLIENTYIINLAKKMNMRLSSYLAGRNDILISQAKRNRENIAGEWWYQRPAIEEAMKNVGCPDVLIKKIFKELTV